MIIKIPTRDEFLRDLTILTKNAKLKGGYLDQSPKKQVLIWNEYFYIDQFITMSLSFINSEVEEHGYAFMGKHVKVGDVLWSDGEHYCNQLAVQKKIASFRVGDWVGAAELLCLQKVRHIFITQINV